MSLGDGQSVQGSENIGQENVGNLQDKNTDLPDAADKNSLSAQEPSGEDGNVPIVYMTSEISAESLIAV